MSPAERRLVMVREMERAGFTVETDDRGNGTSCRVRIRNRNGHVVVLATHPTRFDIEAAYDGWRSWCAQRGRLVRAA